MGNGMRRPIMYTGTRDRRRCPTMDGSMQRRGQAAASRQPRKAIWYGMIRRAMVQYSVRRRGAG